jgi:replicative DNA helicase
MSASAATDRPGRVIDRLPPNNTEAEECVLGSLLMDPEAADHLGDLQAGDFYRERNRAIFEAMGRLWTRREPVDFELLMGELQAIGRWDEVGGLQYLSHLVDVVPTAAHVEHYARKVHECAVRRRLISAAGKIAGVAYDESVELESVLAQAASGIAQVATGASAEDVWTPERQVEEFQGYIDSLIAGKPTGIRSSLKFHDLIRGYRPGSLYVVGAVSGLGKTAWMASEARELTLKGYRVHFASSEMSALELTKRYAAAVLGRDWNRVEQELERIGDYPALYGQMGDMLNRIGAFLPTVYHAGAMTVDRIKRRVARQIATTGCDIVFVDYLQRLKPAESSRRQGRYEQVDTLSMDLKTMAGELGIPVVVAAQFNLKSVLARPDADKTPRDDDFRESGGIYQEADVALGLHRESRYRDVTDPSEAWVYVMKNRHGQADRRFRMLWLPDTVQYVDPELHQQAVREAGR